MPYLVEARDDSGEIHEVVVKIFSESEGGHKASAAELVCSLLGHALGLRPPEPYLVTLPEGFESLVGCETTKAKIQEAEGPYEFITLRYRHDALTAEFVVVGVALRCGDTFIGGRFCSRFTRLKTFFGDISTGNHRALTEFLRRRFNRLSTDLDSFQSHAGKSLTEIAHTFLPEDDGAYQWSKERRGFAEDPEAELDRLYSRLVEYYEHHRGPVRKKDDDVWRSFRGVLDQRHITTRLSAKELTSEDYSYTFPHTWKNGVENILQPLSFDYANPSKAVEKGTDWLGRGVALEDAEPHKFYFLIGEPDGNPQRKATEKALNLINKIPTAKEIVREHERDSFASSIASEIEKHDQLLRELAQD